MAGGKGDGKVLDIKVTDIKAAAPAFHEQGKNLSKALTALIETLDGLGKPWGDDDQGKQFEDAYSPQQKTIESAAGTLVLGLVSIHEAMVDMADGHIDNELLIQGMFTEIKAPHGDGRGQGGGR
ncbi:hypothetical protein [Streptomyces sp. NPDC050560]|uniref:hypothetical protein n=1 Tax=Streptomyces sp. NPDC050560 TaxID=3365630 RepID=UPI0037BACA6B